jgi:hypothetical protein
MPLLALKCLPIRLSECKTEETPDGFSSNMILVLLKRVSTPQF